MTDSYDIRNSAFGICPVPPKGNANFAWVQHFIHHLAPQGMAGFVFANGSMSSNQSGDCNARSARREWATNSQGLGSQRDIRRALLEADLVDCRVALPGQLFYSVAKCFMPCRMINWIKRLNIFCSFAEIRSQGAHISASLKTQMPFSSAIAAPLS